MKAKWGTVIFSNEVKGTRKQIKRNKKCESGAKSKKGEKWASVILNEQAPEDNFFKGQSQSD